MTVNLDANVIQSRDKYFIRLAALLEKNLFDIDTAGIRKEVRTLAFPSRKSIPTGVNGPDDLVSLVTLLDVNQANKERLVQMKLEISTVYLELHRLYENASDYIYVEYFFKGESFKNKESRDRFISYLLQETALKKQETKNILAEVEQLISLLTDRHFTLKEISALAREIVPRSLSREH